MKPSAPRAKFYGPFRSAAWQIAILCACGPSVILRFPTSSSLALRLNLQKNQVSVSVSLSLHEMKKAISRIFSSVFHKWDQRPSSSSWKDILATRPTKPSKRKSRFTPGPRACSFDKRALAKPTPFVSASRKPPAIFS